MTSRFGDFDRRRSDSACFCSVLTDNSLSPTSSAKNETAKIHRLFTISSTGSPMLNRWHSHLTSSRVVTTVPALRSVARVLARRTLV
jgi:hypothetical protein